MPSAAGAHAFTSGVSGSPALDIRDTASSPGRTRPEFRKDRYTVGAAAKVVTASRANTDRVVSAEKPPRSNTVGIPAASGATTAA